MSWKLDSVIAPEEKGNVSSGTLIQLVLCGADVFIRPGVDRDDGRVCLPCEE